MTFSERVARKAGGARGSMRVQWGLPLLAVAVLLATLYIDSRSSRQAKHESTSQDRSSLPVQQNGQASPNQSGLHQPGLMGRGGREDPQRASGPALLIDVRDAATLAPVSRCLVGLDISHEDSGTDFVRLRTGADGTVRWTGVGSKPATVLLHLPAHIREGSSRSQDWRELSLSGREQEIRVSLRARPGRTLEGIVRYADGTPAPHVVVGAVIDDDAFAYARVQVFTDPEGRFRVRGLPRRSVHLWARLGKKGSPSERRTFGVVGPDSRQVVLVFPHGHATAHPLRVRVRSADGDPVSSFRWRVLSPAGTHFWSGRYQAERVHMAKGELTLDATPEPVWMQVWAAVDGNGERLRGALLEAGPLRGEGVHVVTLRAGCTVDVDVHDAAGGTLPVVEVVAAPIWASPYPGAYFREAPFELSRALVMPDGHARLRDLPRGMSIRIFAIVPPDFAQPLPVLTDTAVSRRVSIRVVRAPPACVRVTDDTGHPVEGVWVEVRDMRLPPSPLGGFLPDMQRVAREATDAHGRACLIGLDPNVSYALAVNGDGLSDSPVGRARIEHWLPTDTSVVLDRLGGLSGRVLRHRRGHPRRMDVIRWTAGGYVRLGGVQEQDIFSFSKLPLGVMYVRAWPHGRALPAHRAHEVRVEIPAEAVELSWNPR